MLASARLYRSVHFFCPASDGRPGRDVPVRGSDPREPVMRRHRTSHHECLVEHGVALLVAQRPQTRFAEVDEQVDAAQRVEWLQQGFDLDRTLQPPDLLVVCEASGGVGRGTACPVECFAARTQTGGLLVVVRTNC